MTEWEWQREPRLEETKRIGRVLRIVQLIGAQPRVWTRRRLAESLEVSERMIDNDLQLIRHAVRLVLRRGAGGYYFVGSPMVKPVDLSIAEALALVLAAQQARDTGSVDGPTIAAALARVESALPPLIVPYVRRANLMRNTPTGPLHDRWPVLAILEQAQAEQRRVAIRYASAAHDGNVSERSIAPYGLMPYERSWQVIAHDSLRDEVRMFKVDRIRECSLTHERYDIPSDFDLRTYFGTTWGVLRGESDEPENVVLQFTSRAAPWVGDERWHASQVTEKLPDGGLRLTFWCGITHEFVRWLLSFSGDVSVEEPERLREAVKAEARRVLDEDGDCRRSDTRHGTI
jgi:predicted DNA-binding transcriptional regulator YafY